MASDYDGRMRYVVDLGHVLCGPFDRLADAENCAAAHGADSERQVRVLLPDYLCGDGAPGSG